MIRIPGSCSGEPVVLDDPCMLFALVSVLLIIINRVSDSKLFPFSA